MFPSKRDGDSWNNLNNDIQVKMRGKLKKEKEKRRRKKRNYFVVFNV